MIPILQIGYCRCKLFRPGGISGLELCNFRRQLRDISLRLYHGSVECVLRPFFEREFSARCQDPPRDLGSGVVLFAHHIWRELGFVGVSLGCGGVWSLVAVLKEAALGVGELRKLVEGVITLPFGL